MKKVLSFLMAFSLLFSTVHATETELNNEEVKNEVVTNEVTEEETKTTNEETTESNQENDYKWAAIQPGSTTTSDGIKISWKYNGITKGETGNRVLNFDLVYTILETYEEETLIINPDIFEVIAWGQNATEGEITPNMVPGDTIKVNVSIVNNSKYKYNYDENSFVIYPYTSDELEKEMGFKKLTDEDLTFNGDSVNEVHKFYRLYNKALRELTRISKYKYADLDDATLDKLLKEKGYNGVEELHLYYLDFYNNYFGYGKEGKEKVTKLGDFTVKEIYQILEGDSNPSYVNGEYIKESNPVIIALHFDNLFNFAMGVSLDDEKIDNKNQQDYAPGEYMRNESKGDEKIKEKLGELDSESENNVDMNIHLSGPYMGNAYADYRITGHAHLSYTAAKGNLTVKYVDENGKELSESIFSTGMIGKEYTTEEKEFQYYELLKVEGNRTGLYAEEDTEVIYVYTYVGGTGGDDPDFPRTGIESNNIVEMIAMVSLVALGTTRVLKKKFM